MDNKTSPFVDVLILGAGLTGLSAAYYLGKKAMVIESSTAPGGNASSLLQHGFCLDKGIHVYYFKEPEIKSFIENELQVPLNRCERNAAIWLQDRIVRFPLQYNLSDFPLSYRVKALFSIIHSFIQLNKSNKCVDMAEYFHRNFGRVLTSDFFRPYNEKLWGVKLEEQETEWMDNYIPKPSLANIISNFWRHSQQKYGMNSIFWYPEYGGCGSVSHAFANKLEDCRFQSDLISINPVGHQAVLATGEMIRYKYLISTIPLPNLIAIIPDLSLKLQQLASRLKCNSTTILHLLIPRENVGDTFHWIYVGDSEIPFYRISFPHIISKTNVQTGWSAVTLEFGGNVDTTSQTEKSSIDWLIKMKLLRNEDREKEIKSIWDWLEYGYVIYDRNRKYALASIHTKLRDYDILCVGRYGNWEYSNMESAILQGKRTAAYLKEFLK